MSHMFENKERLDCSGVVVSMLKWISMSGETGEASLEAMEVGRASLVSPSSSCLYMCLYLNLHLQQITLAQPSKTPIALKSSDPSVLWK